VHLCTNSTTQPNNSQNVELSITLFQVAKIENKDKHAALKLSTTLN